MEELVLEGLLRVEAEVEDDFVHLMDQHLVVEQPRKAH